jgi:uncharacterized protein YbjT (DUF2867 family)
MRIGVLGGTGNIGRRVVAALARDGHELRALSRSAPQYAVNLATGAGLPAALEGCEVVVDASNGPSSGKARAVLVEGSRRLLALERRLGVAHHVCVSIVGIEEVPLPYYRVKVEQERIVKAGGVPWSIVRATQLHDLVGGMLASAGRLHVLPAVEARVQPLAVEEAAEVVAAVAAGEPRRALTTVAGPEVHDLRSLGRLWETATGHRALELPLPLPGRLGRALREGALTCERPDVRGRETFAEWLAATGRSASG